MTQPRQASASLRAADHEVDYHTKDIILEPSDILILSTALDGHLVEKFVYSRGMMHLYVLDRAKMPVSIVHDKVYWGDEDETIEKIRQYENNIYKITGWQLMEAAGSIGAHPDQVYHNLNGFQYQVIGAEAAHDDDVVLYLLEQADIYIRELSDLSDRQKVRIALFRVFAAASYFRLMRWEDGLAVAFQGLDISYDGKKHTARLTAQLHGMVVLANIGLYGGKYELRQALPWWDPNFMHVPQFNCRPAKFFWLPEGLKCLKGDILLARALEKRNTKRSPVAVCPRKQPHGLLLDIMQRALESIEASKKCCSQSEDRVLRLSTGGAVTYQCQASDSGRCDRSRGQERSLQLLVEHVGPRITGECRGSDAITKAYHLSGTGAFDHDAFREALHANKLLDHRAFTRRYPAAAYDDAGKYVAYLLDKTGGLSSETDCFICGVSRLRGAITILRECIYADRYCVTPDDIVQLLAYVRIQFGREPFGRRLLKNWRDAVRTKDAAVQRPSYS